MRLHALAARACLGDSDSTWRNSELEACHPQGKGAGPWEPPPEVARPPHRPASGWPCMRVRTPQQEKAKHPRGKVSLIPHTTQQPPSQPDPQGLLAASLTIYPLTPKCQAQPAPHTHSHPHDAITMSEPLLPHALLGKHGKPPRGHGPVGE